MPNQLRILIVDDDQNIGNLLLYFFRKKFQQIEYISDPILAAKKIQTEDFDFLITDILMPNLSGLELMIWAKHVSPNSRLAAMTGSELADFKETSRQLGSCLFFKKPIDLDQMYASILQVLRPEIAGSIRRIQLFDLLQMMCLDPEEKILNLSDQDKKMKGRIWCQNNQVIHAECQLEESQFVGEEALYHLAQIVKGHFEELAWTEPPGISIHSPLSNLVMEIAQRFDEHADAKVKNQEVKVNKQIKNVLIVDDDPISLEVLRSALISRGLNVDTAQDGQEAIVKLQSKSYEMLFTDIWMPKMDGMSLLMWVYSHQPELNVIIVSGRPFEEFADQAHQFQALKLMSKPINLQILDQVMGMFIDRGFSGEVNHIHLLDLLQIYLMSQKNVVLQLQDLKSFQRGHIYVHQGQLWHAEFGKLTGEQAFYQMCAMTSAVFFEKEWKTPDNPTLSEYPTHRLLMNASEHMQGKSDIEVDSTLIELIRRKIYAK